jgi:hypothetical protein
VWSPTYKPPFKFTGTLKKVTVEVIDQKNENANPLSEAA